MRLVTALLLLLAIPFSTFADAPEQGLSLHGFLTQGALVRGETVPGAKVMLDGSPIMVSADGVFAFGFDRDHGPSARLAVSFPDGRTETKTLSVVARSYDIRRIEGLPPKFVNPPPEELPRIAREVQLKKTARSALREATWFEDPFIWPAKGRISGVFGSQSFYNGEARRPHYGLDIAADVGTPVVAPASGIVTLAEDDMYFEGGLIFLDHGQGVTSYYMHLSRIDVKVGDLILQGQSLGAVGASGRATGPHLHWAMFWHEAHLDPSLLIPGVDAEGPKLDSVIGE